MLKQNSDGKNALFLHMLQIEMINGKSDITAPKRMRKKMTTESLFMCFMEHVS
jgi:hypothetical protein